MGSLTGRLFAALYDPFMRRTEEACLQAWRSELLGEVAGDVLEIGAGTGANASFYPSSARVTFSEPDPFMRERLRARGLSVTDADVTSLPFRDASFDAVVATLVLCSVPNVDQALDEVTRVLRPGGVFVFLEHVAGVGDRLKWQRRLEPLWTPLAHGCRLTREPEPAIARRLTLEQVRRESMRGALPFVRPTVRGVARRPPAA